ncbi:MAG: penicillin-binding protein 1A [Nitrospirota bacterium]
MLEIGFADASNHEVSLVRTETTHPLEHPPAAPRKRIGRRLLFWGVVLILALLLAGSGGVYLVTRELPEIYSLKDYKPDIVTTVYADDGSPVAEFCRERRIVVPMGRIPKLLVQAFVAAEDSRFYEHEGLDYLGIMRAMYKNIMAAGIRQGGSTITQQVTKSLLLTPERSITRKIREAILAFRIERYLSKDEILYLYLNQIYLGHNAYGVEAAAQTYFGKSVQELNLAECAMLAGLPQAPSRYSPHKHPDRARERQSYVLNRMTEDGYITAQQAKQALATPVKVKGRMEKNIGKAPYFTEHIRRYLEEKYGEDILYHQGLQVYSTVNVAYQQAAQKALRKGLQDLDKRQGYRGPLAHLEGKHIDTYFLDLKESEDLEPLREGDIVKGVISAAQSGEKRFRVNLNGGSGVLPFETMSWIRRDPAAALKVGDLILVRLMGRDQRSGDWKLALEQEPQVQGAILSLENTTGFVRAMVGGYDFSTSQFNRAVQARRQPGSAFKPIIYAAALDKGYTPATIIIDSPVIFGDEQSERVWKPRNYKETFYGPTLLRTALILSRNVVTIKIVNDIGLDYVIDYARRLGINSPLTRDLSLALGSSALSLLELTRAVSVFPNQGELVQPIFITKVMDRDGRLLEEHKPQREKVMESDTAFVMSHLLEEVVKYGTGWRARALGRPVGGKTGTTNDQKDAWFVGFSPSMTAGVWVGFDNERELGPVETGARAASPIWVDFAAEVLKTESTQGFVVPEKVVFAKINARTGFLARPDDATAVFEAFKEGTAPTKTADEVSPGLDDFFKADMDAEAM